MADDPVAISDNEASRLVRQPVGRAERAPAIGRDTAANEAVLEQIANLGGIRRCCRPHPDARPARGVCRLRVGDTLLRSHVAPRLVNAGRPLRGRGYGGAFVPPYRPSTQEAKNILTGILQHMCQIYESYMFHHVDQL